MRRFAWMPLIVAIGLVGCDPGATVITKDLEGRRVHDLRVFGPKMVYYWSPAQSVSSPNHLVLRDLATGAETDIESPWQAHTWDFDGERVAYFRPAPSGGIVPGEIVIYEVATGATDAIPGVFAHSLGISGNWVVWVQRLDVGKTAVARCRIPDGKPELIDTPLETDRWSDEQVYINGDTVAWVRHDHAKREFRLYRSDVTQPYPVDTGVVFNHRFKIHLGRGKIVYIAGKETDRAVRVFDIAAGTETILAQSERLWSDPQIGGGVVAWLEVVTDKEFEKLKRRPLDDPADWRNVYRYDLATGRMKELAHALHTCFRLRVDGEGKVYAVVQREITDPSQTNLVYGVDVWRW